MNVCHTFHFDPNAPLTKPVMHRGPASRSACAASAAVHTAHQLPAGAVIGEI